MRGDHDGYPCKKKRGETKGHVGCSQELRGCVALSEAEIDTIIAENRTFI